MDGLMLPANLPNSATARLPQVYEAARVALAECSRIDECAEWANKAEALASYARQAEDSSLRQMADRIQARAIRRCGELLKQIEPDKGGRPSETQEGALPRLTRTTVATEAGLSEHQRKTALRVASVPADVFEREVESEAPPTVTTLAKMGTQTRPEPKPLVDLKGVAPDDFNAATKAWGELRRFAEFCRDTDAARVATAMRRAEIANMRAAVSAIDGWLDAFVTRLPQE
jgi:hypothetical protein